MHKSLTTISITRTVLHGLGFPFLLLVFVAGCQRSDKAAKVAEMAREEEERAHSRIKETKKEEARKSDVAQLREWIVGLQNEDAKSRDTATRKLKDYLADGKKFGILHQAAKSEVSALLRSSREAQPESRTVAEELLVHSGDLKLIPTADLLAILHHQYLEDAGKSGTKRKFVFFDMDGQLPPQFPGWYEGHGSLCNIVCELATGRGESQVALPLLQAYFEDLSALACGVKTVDYTGGLYRVTYNSTLGKEFDKGAPSLDKQFGGVYKRVSLYTDEHRWLEYEDRARFDISGPLVPEGTVALLLMNEINSALKKLGAPSAPIVRGLLNHARPVLRANAARCIPLLGLTETEGGADLTPLTKDKDPHVRFQAALALASINPARMEVAWPPIAEGVSDKDKQIVIRRAEEAVPVLLSVVLKQTEWQKRVKAVELLGKIGPLAKGAVSVLSALQNDPSVELRQAAFDALKKINLKD